MITKISRHPKFCNTLFIEKTLAGSKMYKAKLGYFFAKEEYIPFLVNIKDVKSCKEFNFLAVYDNEYITEKRIRVLCRENYVEIDSYELEKLNKHILTDNAITDTFNEKAYVMLNELVKREDSKEIREYIRHFVKNREGIDKEE